MTNTAKKNKKKNTFTNLGVYVKNTFPENLNIIQY